MNARLRDLSLFWKLLLPFTVLLLITGTAGGFIVVRNLAEQARTRLDSDLDQRALSAQASIHDEELYLLESANFAANLQGVVEATRARDTATLARALDSVLALKTNLTLAAITDQSGAAVVSVASQNAAVSLAQLPGKLFAGVADQTNGATNTAFLEIGGRNELAIATSICSGPPGCDPIGAAVVTLDADRLLPADLDASLYDLDGRLVAGRGLRPVPPAPAPDAPSIRRQGHDGGEAVVTMYTPISLQGRRQGTIALTLPTSPAFGSVRSAALRLALVLFGFMVGIVLIGVGLSRVILGQVRGVVNTTEKLGRGDLTARAPVLSGDEIGQLSSGVNAMAEELQASYDLLEQRVAERTEEVQSLLRQRSEFFAAMSHELRTPVAVFLAHADLLDDPTFPKKAAWHAQSAATLRAAGDQILRFVEDILALARAETGGVELDIDRVRVPAILDEARATLEGLAESVGVRLEIHAEKRLPLVLADASRLREIVINLVDNAVKYTPAGGRVHVVATADKSTVRIAIRDTGVGIPPDETERIFEPFYRVRSTSTQAAQPSSGLGLALVKRFVDALGGTIEVVSAPGEGTVFTVSLPAASPRADRPRAS